MVSFLTSRISVATLAKPHWIGDHAHLFSKDISLQTHVQDIRSVVETEELSDFVLVGHSYAGMVISDVPATP